MISDDVGGKLVMQRRRIGMRTKRNLRASGFTLLELLTVMAIMMMLMGMAVAAYFGIMRSAGMQGAVMNVRTTLGLARQYAVTQRCRTHVMFWQDGTNSHYQVCRQDGSHVGGANATTLVIDPARWTDGSLGGSEIYNLTTGTHGTIQTNTASQLTARDKNNALLRWNPGDKYGWPLRGQAHLPEGVSFFNGDPANVPESVVYKPDGTTERGAGGDYTIEMWELYEDASSTIKKRISVDGLTGLLRVEDA